MLPAEQVIDDLEALADAVVDGGGIGEHEELERLVVTQRAQHVVGDGGIDLDLDSVLVGPQVMELGAEPLAEQADERTGGDGCGQRTSPSQCVR